jgi:hypothetical protein
MWPFARPLGPCQNTWFGTVTFSRIGPLVFYDLQRRRKQPFDTPASHTPSCLGSALSINIAPGRSKGPREAFGPARSQVFEASAADPLSNHERRIPSVECGRPSRIPLARAFRTQSPAHRWLSVTGADGMGEVCLVEDLGLGRPSHGSSLPESLA